MSQIRSFGVLGSLCCFALLGGCANDTVNLGGGRIAQEIQRASRCSTSPVVTDSVRVRRQSDLDDLAGCEEIRRDLRIEIFAGADLSPLAALRVVGGSLEIGAYPETPEGEVDTEELARLRRQIDEIVADGYLPSLHGLEGLERAGSLEIYSIAAQDLEPLRGLRELSGRTDDVFMDGFLAVHDAVNLRDLHGLSNLQGVTNLVTTNNLALRSLGDIPLAARVTNINLINSPLLDDLHELAPVASAYTLFLSNLGITDLDDLPDLNFVEYGISLSNQRNLRNIDAIADCNTAMLTLHENALLQEIPALSNMWMLEVFMAVDNPQLHSITLDLPVHGEGPDYVQGHVLTDPIKVFDIGRNAKLSRVSLAAGLAQGRFLALYENPSLVRVELGTLTRLEQLSISDNASLASLDLGALRSVESLSVLDNPSLDTAPLAALRTFDAILSGNADTPAPAP